jgi:hexosaminidase
VWISSDNVKAVTEKGFKLVHAASDFFYLVCYFWFLRLALDTNLIHQDCGGGGWLGNFSRGNSWCDPFKTWQEACRMGNQVYTEAN